MVSLLIHKKWITICAKHIYKSKCLSERCLDLLSDNCLTFSLCPSLWTIGCAFVTFSSRSSAANAIKCLNHTTTMEVRAIKKLIPLHFIYTNVIPLTSVWPLDSLILLGETQIACPPLPCKPTVSGKQFPFI